MRTSEALTKPPRESLSLWQRSVWPLVLFVALPIFVLSVIVGESLSLGGRLDLMVRLGAGGAIGLAVSAIFVKASDVRELRRQRCEAEVGPEPQTEAAL